MTRGGSYYPSRDGWAVIDSILELYRNDGFDMPYTMQEFRRDYVKEHLKELTPEERMAGLSPAQRMAGLTPRQIRQYLDRLTAERPATTRKPRRKKSSG